MSAVAQAAVVLAEVGVGCSPEENILGLAGLALDVVVDHTGVARIAVGLEAVRSAGVHSCLERIGFVWEVERWLGEDIDWDCKYPVVEVAEVLASVSKDQAVIAVLSVAHRKTHCERKQDEPIADVLIEAAVRLELGTGQQSSSGGILRTVMTMHCIILIAIEEVWRRWETDQSTCAP